MISKLYLSLLILLPVSQTESGGKLRTIIKEINRTQLEAQDILSDNLYYYNHFEHKIKIF
ncbi:MAG: DUF5688 family protein [Roseburia sp.]|nr:DUF5688 family protein [Roseburia sp.]